MSITTSEFEQFSSLFAGNTVFVEELYARYAEDPRSVDASWQSFFDGLGDNALQIVKQATGASWHPRDTKVIGQISAEDKSAKKAKTGKGGGYDEAAVVQAARDSIGALMLIRAYRVRGHLDAHLDPLRLADREPHPELDPKSYGFSEDDYDRPIFLNGVLGKERETLREIVAQLRATYCSTLGVEFMHIQYPEQKAWLQREIENAYGKPHLSKAQKIEVLKDLVEVEAFEQFLHVKFPGTKRFSVQGGDSMIPGLEQVIHTASKLGVKEIVMGMPHRGRMNVLTTVMGKPYAELLSVFHGNLDYPEWVASSGDVKYHLGVSSDRTFEDGNSVHLSLTANPSHLEAVNPVVAGKVRAKQDQLDDAGIHDKVMGILMHGDAAFAGQGIVPETIALSELQGYKTGGTVHIIVNNQIGFTATPKDSRFTPYPSDVAKGVQAPIFHVNGDDPEAVVFACDLATRFRHEFKRDVVIDIFCYRKYGHNEGDEPMFTQPLMYNRIANKRLPAIFYADNLIAEGVVSQADVDQMFSDFREKFDKDFEIGKNFTPNTADWLEGKWAGLARPEEGDRKQPDTGLSRKELESIGLQLAMIPENININRKLVRMLENRKAMIESGEGLDWAAGEALAYASLIKEGFPVRLSGQDSIRGTFSHRHSKLVDQDTEEKYTIYEPFHNGHAKFEVHNSNLSEFAVLGFEYGYSLTEPKALTIWEAQFGDFANGAQVIIDQFIASGEIKWLRMSGLVMLLPHGYEGQGPEHSSARLERYLQLCAEDNMQVANCTTPANFFHILRRQLHRDFRKPLIVMTPKSLLRHKLAVSSLAEFEKGTRFLRLIPEVEKLPSDKKVRRVILCSGKVYYDLYEEREKQGAKDIAIVRVEQYYPFPATEMKKELARYPDAEIVWCQEEPKNAGAWSFVAPLIEDVLEEIKHKGGRPSYVGRPAAASPATGYLSLHQQQQQRLVEEAVSTKTKLRKAG